MAFHNLFLLWLGLAVLLGLAELAVPGVYLIFVAVAAAITGLVTLAMPGLPLAGQLVLLAFWSVVTVIFVRRWYDDNPAETTDPLLNERGARLVGEIVTVTEPIDHGRGRVRLGDGEWLALGPDMPRGSTARVVGVEATSVLVEPLPSLPVA